MVTKYSNNSVIFAVLICVILIYSDLIPENDFSHINSLINSNDITQISGQLLSSPQKTSDGKYYSTNFSVYNAKNSKGITSSASGKLKVFIPCEYVEAYFPGKLYSSIKAKTDSKNELPLWESGGIYSVKGRISSKGFYITECLSSSFSNNFFGILDKFRALCRIQFKRLLFSWGYSGGLLLALLCGAKEYTEQAVSLAFKNAGLSHILALSGMHLSMFSGIAMFFGNKTGRRKLTIIIRIIALFIFVWFAGFSPSLLRAFICNLLLIVCLLANVRKPDMLVILCFSFIIQSIISPSDIYNIGFMLSYSALAGILIFNKFFMFLYIKLFPKSIAASLSSSTGAQIFTAPISLKYFGTFSPIGIIATVIISPCITIFIYSGLFLILLSLVFPILSSASGIFMNIQYTIINLLVTFFSKAFIWRLN